MQDCLSYIEFISMTLVFSASIFINFMAYCESQAKTFFTKVGDFPRIFLHLHNTS